MRLLIRAEAADERAAVVRINDDAFGGTAESRLIESISRTGRPTISLVACADGAPVGHIFFSEVHMRSDGPVLSVFALAPMAVVPAWQRRGIGSRLVESGLDACVRRGGQVVVVVGHPAFYPRFGFVPASRVGLRSVYSSAGDAFMAFESPKGALAGRAGVVEYPAEFADV